MVVLRHLLSILLLPFLVTVVVPYWLLNVFAASDTHWGNILFLVRFLRLSSGVFLVVGFLLFSWCVSLFARVGRGTLAPWDPTQNLVAVGPYRFVRNPMISGVTMMLIGQAIFWGSWVLGSWAGIFMVVNHVYFVLSEEPGLESRFGEGYQVYKANVPRWVPRLKPWAGK